MIRDFLKRKGSIYWILGINLLLRLIIVFFTNLGNDEVYYTTYALYLDYSFFDHPPLVGILIRLSTFNLSFIYNDFFVRLGPLIIGCANIYLIYKIGCLLKDKTTGIISALIISASFYSSIITGVFILPDTPLSIFWLLAIFFFCNYIIKKQNYWLLLYGVVVGLSLLSKYHAIFLWLGAGIYFLFYNRKELFKPYLWLSIIISIILFSPVIWWNMVSEYSGINYHSNRVGSNTWLPSLKNFFPEFFGQIFYNNPFTIYVIILSLFFIIKQKKYTTPVIGFLLSISIPLISTTLIMALYNKTLPHWSGPSYFALAILAGYVYSSINIKKHKKRFQKAIVFGNLFLLLVVTAAIIQIKTGIVLPSSYKESQKIGKKDFTIDIGLWKNIATELESRINKDIKAGLIPKNHVILTHNWFPGSHLDYYYAQPNNTKLYVLGNSYNQHKYMEINTLRGEIPINSSGYYITTSHNYKTPKQELLNRYKTVSKPIIIPVYIRHKNRVNIFIWRLSNLKNNKKPF